VALDERQLKAIELLAEGSMKIAEIAKVCDVSRQSIWLWRQEPEFKEKLDERLTQIKTEANEKISSSLPVVVDELIRLALSDKTPIREKKDCLQYLCNRVLGAPTTTANVDIGTTTESSTSDPVAGFKAFLAKEKSAKGENTEG